VISIFYLTISNKLEPHDCLKDHSQEDSGSNNFQNVFKIMKTRLGNLK